MTSIFEITDWAHVASFFVWTLAVCALAKAIFGSFLAAELQHRLSLRDAPRRQRMNRLNWELNNRVVWDEDVARRSPHAAKRPLTDTEIESRRAELRQLARRSLTWRAFTYLMRCFACQAFWVTVTVFPVTRGATDFVAWLFSAAAYSGAATILSLAVLNRHHDQRAATGTTGCKACGK